MPINVGAVIGQYEIVSLIGTGGMGEVYQATDRQLNRAVAIKFLRSPLASDPERIARFKMEARLVASLNHPNIAAVYGLAEMQSARVLVMEFVDGRTLADCIAHGPMPIEEALLVAKQIAEALEYAHDRGVVHRDLKPANIKLTPEGRVKVLDFGLAKAMRDDLRANMLESTQAPTETQPGVILGSVAYMSPEQAKGIGVDRRTDVWAFGVILYEMLIGHRLFKEQTTSETIAAVLKKELTWEGLPSSTPPPVRRLLQRCLTRDPHRRLRDIGEARIVIDEVLANPTTETSGGSETAPSSTSGKRKARWVQITPWIIAVGAIVSAAATGLAPWRMPERPTPPVLRLNAALGIDATLSMGQAPAAFLSPDSKMLAFTAVKRPGDKPQIYVRRLDQLQATPLAETEGVLSAFFSPSSRWIAFFADGKLKKVSVNGGVPITLADVLSGGGGSWSQEDTIVFATNNSPIMRVSSTGGKPQAITTLDNAAGETSHRCPQLLPDGKTILFTTNMSGIVNYDNANIAVQSLSTGERKIIQRDAYCGRYLPSGHLVFMHNGTLFGVPFDLKRLELTAQPAPVLEGVKTSPISGSAQFSFSDTGFLVYWPGARQSTVFSIFWLAQDGSLRQLRGPENYANIRFSPDGRRLSMEIRGQRSNIWVYDLERNTMSRFTFGQYYDSDAIWTPDGQRVTFSSFRANNVSNLYWQRADGTGDVQRLTESNNNQFPHSWHPSGKYLAFQERRAQTLNDIMILPMEGDQDSGWKPGQPTAFVATPFNETNAAFSPDGRWLAYESDESGQPEVYVRAFPGPGPKWQVSTSTGLIPMWSRRRKELFFRTDDQKIMVAPYTVERGSFSAAKPRQWSEGVFSERGPTWNVDLHPDGTRFAVLKIPDERAEANPDNIVIIINFFEELRRITSPSH